MKIPKIPSRAKILNHFEERDKVMARVVRGHGPFLLKSQKNYFILLCRAIVAQQISVRAAETITGRFQKLFEGRTRPTPQKVWDLPESKLLSVGLSRQKAKYIRDLSGKFLDETIRPHELPYLSNEEVIERLTSVYGIGRWTAEMFLIFSLNRLDVFPVGDLAFITALKNIYQMRSRPSPRRLDTIRRKWHPFETVGTWYAWRTMDAEIVAY